VTIDDTIDRLVDTLTSAGIELSATPKEPPMLRQLAAAIKPQTLPGQLATWWRRGAEIRRRVEVWPNFCEPEFALARWQSERHEDPRQEPSVFVTAAYAALNQVSVELDGPDGEGGAVFQWSFEGPAFYLRYHCLAEWLTRIEALVRGGCYQRQESGRAPWISIIDDHDTQQHAIDTPLPPHPRYGTVRQYPKDPQLWPSHWQRASFDPR
jgi:hypothetical protein